MPSYAFFHNEFVPLAEAKISVMTHSLHYGTAVFEGIRGNWNEQQQQMYIFRLEEHYQRLQDGSQLLRMNLKYSVEDMCRITIELAQKCGFRQDIYMRPLAYKSAEALGVRLHDLDNDFLVFAIPWGRYLDMDACRCGISSWRRPADNVIPPSAKITGLYINNAFTKTEAADKGFDEGIMLSPDGHVSEGSGENLFILKDGRLITPPVNNSILVGITRDTVMTLAKNEMGIETIERPIDPEELFSADECFLTGTAAHVTPIAEIDNRKIGNGHVGEIAGRLQKLYFEVIKGNNPKYIDWCTPVYKK
jgi:branched-chain amino acid aminotransferase